MYTRLHIYKLAKPRDTWKPHKEEDVKPEEKSYLDPPPVRRDLDPVTLGDNEESINKQEPKPKEEKKPGIFEKGGLISRAVKNYNLFRHKLYLTGLGQYYAPGSAAHEQEQHESRVESHKEELKEKYEEIKNSDLPEDKKLEKLNKVRKKLGKLGHSFDDETSSIPTTDLNPESPIGKNKGL